MQNLYITDTCRFLKAALYKGDFDEFDRVIDEYQKECPDDIGMKELSSELINFFHYIFSFQSFSTDREFNRNERLRREMKVLEVFPYDFQIEIIMLEIDDVRMEHMATLKLPSTNIPRTQEIHLVTSLLFKKKFQELDLFLSKVSWDISNLSKIGYFCYSEKNVRGSVNVLFEKPLPIFASSLFFLDNDIYDYLKEKDVSHSDFINIKNNLSQNDIEKIVAKFPLKEVKPQLGLDKAFSLIEKDYLLVNLQREQHDKPKKTLSKI